MNYKIDQAVEILRQTPQTLNTLLSNLSDDWIFCNEGGESWNAFDIVGHLIHGEKTDWIARLKIILNQSSNITFESYNRFAQFENSKGKTMSELLKAFSELRTDNLSYLESLHLSEAQLKLKGIHPELGEVTLKELLACWVTHDLGHISQIARVMAKQYKNEVGPWVAYIPILNK
ncbi:hypothetical protein A9Q87_04250 [Flavobacteriales bacterium 34_180_T64]|nr:hypothetical protein A9Q87_04250 [Flavobacteriales bacterium 34_180_T64]